MTFTLDTGWTHPDIAATTTGADRETQRIVVTTHKRATNLFNKIRANIEAHEDQFDLDTYMEREGMTLDALHLFDPHVATELQDIYETHRSCLVHGGAAREAQPRTQPAQTVQDDNKANERKDDVQSGYW